MSPVDEIRLAERIADDLYQRQIPANELGKTTRLVQRTRSLQQALAGLDALANDRDHFVRSGQTRRYARELGASLRKTLATTVDANVVVRVLGWARKLLEYRSTQTGPVRTHSAERTLPPRGTRRQW
jgi:hypothetical protein